jgi:AcrR family transcriptional regulator
VPSRRAAATDTPVRRQARGRARIESILDAADEIVAEVGYGEMTTNGVAARAGISPGSLYQFFGNKAAILDGLIERHEARLDAFWDELLAGDDAVTLPLADVVDGVLDAVIALKAERPAFWALFHGSATSDRLEEAARRLDASMAERLDRLYGRRAPWLEPDRRRLVADVSVATVKALMSVAGTRGAPGDERSCGAPVPPSTAALAELKVLLIGYLEPALAPPP